MIYRDKDGKVQFIEPQKWEAPKGWLCVNCGKITQRLTDCDKCRLPPLDTPTD